MGTVLLKREAAAIETIAPKKAKRMITLMDLGPS